MNIKVSAVFEENGKIEPEYIYRYDGLAGKQIPYKLKVEAVKKVYNIHIFECSYARNGAKERIKIKYHLRGNFWFSDEDPAPRHYNSNLV
ncbi:MAG TPA: hypothetical protein GXX75_09135 [Clostridiales bacterium]|nr:hypothetical protein [Clostridiales bacterium]